MLKMGEDIEPIELKTYQCPKCNQRIVGLYEEAKEHVNIPKDSPLPLGLVYTPTEPPFHPHNALVLVEAWGIDCFHSYNYVAAKCFTGGRNFGYSGCLVLSKEFREKIKNGELRLLTKSEVQQFIEWNPDINEKLKKKIGNELVISMPELEELANSEV